MAKRKYSFTDIVNIEEDKKIRTNMYKFTMDKIVENKKNNYGLHDIEKLSESIEQLGLLQPLLVKKNDKGLYEIVAGHRRYTAIKNLLDKKRLESDYEVLCKVIEEDENELITRLKLHETNLQTRSLLKLPEDEKLEIIEDYMDILKQAKKEKIEINGKPVKGKTRDLIAERFNIADKTARKLIKQVKEKGGTLPPLEDEKERGGKVPPLEEKNQKKTVDTLKKMIKQIDKLEFDNSKEEIEAKEKLIELLM